MMKRKVSRSRTHAVMVHRAPCAAKQVCQSDSIGGCPASIRSAIRTALSPEGTIDHPWDEEAGVYKDQARAPNLCNTTELDLDTQSPVIQ
ncbi:hypothetical protein ACFLSG_01040 [Candidatus Bipolaricaulota bacterium]